MATMPSTGPGTRTANASRKPLASRTTGTRKIVATVRVKPIASCMVTAVPT